MLPIAALLMSVQLHAEKSLVEPMVRLVVVVEGITPGIPLLVLLLMLHLDFVHQLRLGRGVSSGSIVVLSVVREIVEHLVVAVGVRDLARDVHKVDGLIRDVERVLVLQMKCIKPKLSTLLLVQLLRDV